MKRATTADARVDARHLLPIGRHTPQPRRLRLPQASIPAASSKANTFDAIVHHTKPNS